MTTTDRRFCSLELTKLLPLTCPLGYTRDQVEQVVAGRLDEFAAWSRGTTVAVCNGRRYDHDRGEYQPTECAGNPHGVVVYPWDLADFIRGGDCRD